jgi:endonuclease/exonuclease/phosphatase family metal-dependent hydrolase
MHRRSILSLVLLIGTWSASTGSAWAQTELTVVTWNIAQSQPPNVDPQMDFLAALTPRPDVIVLQEAKSSLIATYKSRLQFRTGQTWNHVFALHCRTQAPGGASCQIWSPDEGVLLLTPLPIVSSEAHYLKRADEHWNWRGAVRAMVTVGTTNVNIFNVHLPVTTSSTIAAVADLKAWAGGHASPRLIGGDFQAKPDDPEIEEPDGMTGPNGGQYREACRELPGSTCGPTSPNGMSQIDYWFADQAGTADEVHATVPASGTLSDHKPVLVTYEIGGSTGSGGNPYNGSPFAVPTLVQAEHFDLGGEGVAYHDDTPGNLGGVFRPSEAVDIEATTDTGGGYNVGWLRVGEWLTYTIDVGTAGSYDLMFRVASNGVGGTFHVEVDGANVTGPLQVPNTGGWQTWTWVPRNNVSLTAGIHVLKFVVDTVGPTATVGNLNSIDVRSTSAGGGGTPYTGAPFAIPAVIQAEQFDLGGEGVAYHDDTPGNLGGAFRTSEAVDIEATTDTGGGHNVGWMRVGEWLTYTISVGSSGTYAIDFRVASNGTGGTLHIEIDGVAVPGTVQVPSTGGWQTWTTVPKTGLSLTAGTHLLKLVVDTVGPTTQTLGNLNWVQIRP